MRALVGTARNRWLALQRELGLRLSKQLFDDIALHPLKLAQTRSPPLTFSLSLAYVIATAVYATNVAFGLVGATLVLDHHKSVWGMLLGLLLLLICVVSIPRFAKLPDNIVSRSEYPILYDLGDRIARALGGAPLDGIAVSADFGANYRVVGWRRRRYVEMGAPLMAILSPEECAAVIAHELSHGVNGDPLRGQYLSGAVRALAAWAIAIRPASIGNVGAGMPYEPIVSVVAMPFAMLALGASEVLFLALKAFVILVLRQSQRAEYLADLLASRVAGSEEMQRALEKTYLLDVVDSAVQRHALTRPGEALGSTLADAIKTLPESLLERYRAESRTAQWQVDATHPPTAMRIDMLAAHDRCAPTQLLSSAERDGLVVEVAHLVKSAQREMIYRKVEAMYQ